MKVMLISPPYPKDKIFRKSMKNLGAVLPCLGMAYIAAMLEKYNHEVRIIDGPALATVKNYNFEDLRNDIKNFQPDVIGISASTSQIDHAKKSISIAKDVKEDSIIILGGTLISADPNALLEFEQVDFGVYGEADLTFPEILRKVESNERVEYTEGVVWRENGIINFLKPKMIIDLDDIPMPARHLLDMSIYRPSPANYRRLPATTMMTSRGCPYKCIFCSRPTEGTSFRAHSAQRVVDEIEHLVKEYGIRDIQFFDDTFTMIPNRVEKICEGIIKRKLDISWNCMTRVDRVSPQLLRLMKKAGCYEVGVGIESGSDRILNFIKKSLNTNQVRTFVRWANAIGIDVRGFFMFGFPTEAKEEVMQTINFAKELDLDVAQFMIATPYPGTELWEIVKQEQYGKLNTDDWGNFTFYAPDKLPFTPNTINEDELIALYKKAYRSFYLRPKFIARQIKKIRTFNDFRRSWLAAKGVLGI